MWDSDETHSPESQQATGNNMRAESNAPSLWRGTQGNDTAATEETTWTTRTDGTLSISAATRTLMDNFLSEHARDTPENLAAQFKEAHRASLTEPALIQASELMMRYATYKAAVASIDSQKSQAPNLEPSLAAMVKFQQASALREQFLGKEYQEALFGQEERRERYALQRQQIMSVQGWSEQQRDEELSSLAREYPQEAAELAPQGR